MSILNPWTEEHIVTRMAKSPSLFQMRTIALKVSATYKQSTSVEEKWQSVKLYFLATRQCSFRPVWAPAQSFLSLEPAIGTRQLPISTSTSPDILPRRLAFGAMAQIPSETGRLTLSEPTRTQQETHMSRRAGIPSTLTLSPA